MKNLNRMLAAVTLMILLSFSPAEPKEKITRTTGSYGVCSCEGKATVIELSINEDFTFRYLNKNNPSEIIDVSGKWELKNNTIILKDYTSDFPIHEKWAIDKNEQCLKSRKGLYFMRLCNTENC